MRKKNQSLWVEGKQRLRKPHEQNRKWKRVIPTVLKWVFFSLNDAITYNINYTFEFTIQNYYVYY